MKKNKKQNLEDLRKELELMHSQFDYFTDSKKVYDLKNISKAVKGKKNKNKTSNTKDLKKHLDIAMEEYRNKVKFG